MCVRELPELDRLYEDLRDDGDVVVLAIGTGTPARVERLLRAEARGEPSVARGGAASRHGLVARTVYALKRPFGRSPPPPPPDPFTWTATATAEAVRLVLHVPAGTHVYRDQIEISTVVTTGVVLTRPTLPAGVAETAPDGSVRERYDADVVITVPIAVADAGRRDAVLLVRHQGCRGDLCWAPREQTLAVDIPP